MPKLYNCEKCKTVVEGRNVWGATGKYFCYECFHTPITKQEFKKEWKKLSGEIGKVAVVSEIPTVEFNEPGHYHQHDMDTITFLQKGFPPHVCMGFLLGNVVKYAQRAEYKNGLEDFEKMVDYAKRALEWYKKNPSK